VVLDNECIVEDKSKSFLPVGRWRIARGAFASAKASPSGEDLPVSKGEATPTGIVSINLWSKDSKWESEKMDAKLRPLSTTDN
jgi:hypothetical protein